MGIVAWNAIVITATPSATATSMMYGATIILHHNAPDKICL